MYYQYGENRYPKDTALANNEGEAVFESSDTLTGGVFLFYLSNKKAFEFLLTEENNFSVQADTNDIMNTLSFTNSKENTAYYTFLKRYKFDEFQMQLLQRKLSKKITTPDSISILKKTISAYQSQLEQIKTQTIKNNPNSLVADLLQASIAVAVPKNIPTKEQGAWLKKHFLDNIRFANSKLAFSNVLYINYTRYINECGFPNTDSVISCCDAILQQASASKENFKWSLYFLGNSFERSSVKGQDKIFVHLVENYYEKNRSWWLTPDQLQGIYQKAEALKKIFIGAVCPNFTASDSAGKEIQLHQQIKKTSLLVFWSYDCAHCLQELPKIKTWLKIHPEISLITACVLPDEEKWKEKLKLLKLPGTHLIDSELKANYIQLYSISGTPEVFVIDQNKKIKAKHLADMQELNEFFTKK